MKDAARTLGLDLHFLNVATESEFDEVFLKVIELRAGGLVIAPNPLFSDRAKSSARFQPAIASLRYRSFANS